MPASMTASLHYFLHEMQQGCACSVRHITLLRDGYSCGIWSCWLANELHSFADLHTWLDICKELIAGVPHTHGDVLQHLYLQMRMLAELSPLKQPPNMMSADAIAIFAERSAITYSCQQIVTLQDHAPYLEMLTAATTDAPQSAEA